MQVSIKPNNGAKNLNKFINTTLTKDQTTKIKGGNITDDLIII